jgi:Fe2+ or Zn2+ uptake regulation protein
MFLIERRFHVAESEMPKVGRRSRKVIEEQFPEITWHHSHVVVDDEGTVKSYCVYEAPTEEIVRRHSMQLGQHEIEGIYEIAGDVSPEDFPLS